VSSSATGASSVPDARRWAVCLLLLLAGILTPTLALADGPAVTRDAVVIRLQSLSDPQPDVRAAALISLVQLGAGAVPHLGAMLLEAERDWEERTRIAWLLGEINAPSSKEALKKAWAVKDAPPTFRIQVAFALGALGDTKPLRSFLTKETERIFLAKAAIGLANLGDKEARPLLEPFKADPDVGSFVVLALGRLGDASVKAELRELLKEAMFREYAAVALATLGDRTVLFQLRFALDHGDVFVRRDAAHQLGRLEDDEALDKLKKLSRSDPDERVQKAASRAVKRIERAMRRKR